MGVFLRVHAHVSRLVHPLSGMNLIPLCLFLTELLAMQLYRRGFGFFSKTSTLFVVVELSQPVQNTLIRGRQRDTSSEEYNILRLVSLGNVKLILINLVVPGNSALEEVSWSGSSNSCCLRLLQE